MGLFGKSFEEQVNVALDTIRKQGVAKSLSAKIDGKTVTLIGEVSSADAKAQIMNTFNSLVETENTINMIKIDRPEPAPAPAAAAPAAVATGPVAAAAAIAIGATGGETIHEVVSGDTLSGLAKKYLGNGNKYMEIFNANKDQLTDPDKIKVGQKLRIPR